MAVGWTTPTITHRRGRLVRHTYVTAAATLNGTTWLEVSLPNMPQAVFAGMLQARSDGGTATDVSALIVRAGNDAVGAVTGNDIFSANLTVGPDPDYYDTASVFRSIIAPTNANYMNTLALPTREWHMFARSQNALNIDAETLTVHLGLLSHVLEV